MRPEFISIENLDLSGGAAGAGFHVTKFSWSKTPRTKRRSRPRSHGSVDLTRYYEGRFYNMEGVLFDPDLTDAELLDRLELLNARLALDGDTATLQWQLSGGDIEQAEVRIEGDLDYAFDSESPNLIRWALTLFAEDPRRYGAFRSGSYDPTLAGTGAGVVFPLTFPIEFEGSATNNLAVENAGNFPSPPLFLIAGPVINPIIDNDSTGESITTTGLELLVGEVCEIDVDAKTLKVNSALRPEFIDAALTDWFDIDPGVNLLRLRGSSMVTGETELSVSFNDARI